MNAKGLIAAGGEATRLGELTRVVNKHLLPVGAWPMIYYPLQLLQLAGVEHVLIVTGQGHAGQLIDLLGNGRMGRRGGDGPLFDLDLTYKVQVEAGGIAQEVGDEKNGNHQADQDEHRVEDAPDQVPCNGSSLLTNTSSDRDGTAATIAGTEAPSRGQRGTGGGRRSHPPPIGHES